LFWLIINQSVSLEKVDSLLAQAQYLYENRHRKEEYFEESKKIWQDVLNSNPHNEKVLRRLSEVNLNLGSQAKTKAEQIRYFEQGKALAETLLIVNDNNPWGHFWFASNYGKICRIKGVLKSLSGLSKIKSEFNRALELDPKNGDIIYARAVVYLEAPGFAGGDKKKAELHPNLAINIEPQFTLPYLELAQYYARVKRLDEAKELLNKMLAIDEPKYPADFFLNDKPKAVELLSQIEH